MDKEQKFEKILDEYTEHIKEKQQADYINGITLFMMVFVLFVFVSCGAIYILN